MRQFLAELVYSDNEEARIDPEQRFALWVRNIARDEANKPVQVVAALPADAPAGSLFRLSTNTTELWMGNGPARPLTRFVAS